MPAQFDNVDLVEPIIISENAAFGRLPVTTGVVSGRPLAARLIGGFPNIWSISTPVAYSM